MQDFYAHCEALVRAADKDRYLAGLFAPAAARRHLYALYAFAGEIERVREAAREPLPGEIRLQWWRDALAGGGEATANPVAAALLDTIGACALPTDPLIGLIDAHAFDLYDDALPSLADLDAYAERTSGTLFALGANILGVAEAGAAAAPAGIAHGLAQVLCNFPLDAARGRMLVPLDLLARHGIARQELEARQVTAGLRTALAALRARARTAFADFRVAARALPAAAAPAFLTAALVPQLLARLDAAGADPFAVVEVAQWRRQWALWRAARNWPA